MLADAVLPEADDEFSYREDPGFTAFVDPYADLRARLLVGERLRHPLIPIPRTFDVAAENARIFAIQHPRSHNDAIGYRPYEFAESVAARNDRSDDPVSHPSHYTSSEAKCPGCGRGIEARDVTETFSFLRGSAIKYLWRAGLKGDTLEDLRKAAQCIEREIGRLSSC